MVSEGEKNTQEGGGLNRVFPKVSFTFEPTYSDSEQCSDFDIRSNHTVEIKCSKVNASDTQRLCECNFLFRCVLYDVKTRIL